MYILKVTEWQHSKSHKEYLKQTLTLYIRQLRSRNKKQFIKSHTDKARLRVEPTSPVAWASAHSQNSWCFLFPFSQTLWVELRHLAFLRGIAKPKLFLRNQKPIKSCSFKTRWCVIFYKLDSIFVSQVLDLKSCKKNKNRMVKGSKALVLDMWLNLRFKAIQGLGNFQLPFIRYLQRNGICLCLEGLWFLLRQAEIKIADFLTRYTKAGERETREFSLLNSLFYSDLAFQLLRKKKQKVQTTQLLYSEWFIKSNELTKLCEDSRKHNSYHLVICVIINILLILFDAFKLWCWRHLRVPWTARSSQSIQKEISPEYSLEGLMLKLKLQYFGHLMQRTDFWKNPGCWERLKVGGEGDSRGWDGWMASPTWWTWVWVNSGSWWWTGRPGMLQSMDLQSLTWLSNWTELINHQAYISLFRVWNSPECEW